MQSAGLVNKNLFEHFHPKKTYKTPMVRTLWTKSDVWTTTFTAKRHLNIIAEENFRTKMYESNKRAKPDKAFKVYVDLTLEALPEKFCLVKELNVIPHPEYTIYPGGRKKTGTYVLTGGPLKTRLKN